MADDTPAGETVTPGDSKTTVTSSAPDKGNADAAEVERFRKEAEQAKMQASQLKNKLDAKEKAEAEAKAKQLEEKEEFKTLYEQAQTRLAELEAEGQAREKARKLETATEDVLKDYPDSVKELAATAGLKLLDDTDEARNALKEKLDAFKAKVAPAGRTTPNNPRPQQPANAEDRQALVERESPGGPSPMALAGAKGDFSVARKYIGSLPAIQRMREIANGE